MEKFSERLRELRKERGLKQKEMAGDDKTHIGMMNVRERLVRQCSGTMEVNSVPGEGTVVNIYIPKT